MSTLQKKITSSSPLSRQWSSKVFLRSWRRAHPCLFPPPVHRLLSFESLPLIFFYFWQNAIFHMVFNQVDPILPSRVARYLMFRPFSLWFMIWKYKTRQIWMNDIYSDDSWSLSELTNHELISVATSQLEMSEVTQPPPSEPDPWLSGSKALGRNSTSAKQDLNEPVKAPPIWNRL